MNKKILPFLALLAALLIFIWIKKKQRGPVNTPVTTTATREQQPFDRDIHTITYSNHALCRMDCRQISRAEVKEVLETGTINYSKVEDSKQGRSYPMEAVTSDNQHVRVVFAPHDGKLVVVTAIDLEKEWPCNCN